MDGEAHFIRALETALGDREAAREVQAAFVDIVHAEVALGGRVAIAGFGVFDASPRLLREGWVKVRFRPGSRFRAAVNDGKAPATEPSLPKTLRLQYFEIPAGVSLSAVLPDGLSRCGIYVLHFENGFRYVGQALNVLSRFSDHRRHWGQPISGIDFAPVDPRELDVMERRVLQTLERQAVPLYNTSLVGLPQGPNPLDLVVNRVQQERWLVGIAEEEDLSDRVALALERPRTGVRWHELREHPEYQDLRLGLMLHLLTALPSIADTERRFWSMTSLPSTNRSRQQRRLATISVNNVESLVLVDLRDGDQWIVGGFINVAPDIVGELEDTHLKEPHTYRTVGEVDAIHFDGVGGLLELLQREDVRIAARRFNLGLMRKGRGMMGRFHDDTLADDVFALLENVLPGTSS